MKTIKLDVELTFEDNIDSDDEIANVVKNVHETLVHEVNSGIGLAPDNTETFTTKIVVREPFTKTTISKTI